MLERINPECRGHRLRLGRALRRGDAGSGSRTRCKRSRRSPVICTGWPTGSPPCGVTSVAMEATGVYWIPLYEILEARGFEVLPRERAARQERARRARAMCADCEWLRELHSVGLLRGSFRQTDEIVAPARVSAASAHAGGDERAPTSSGCRRRSVQMNLQLPLVVSDITGVTGLRILRDIVGRPARSCTGSPQHRDPRCHASHGRDRRRLDGPLSAGTPLRVAAESRALRHVSEAAGGRATRAIDSPPADA